MSFFRSARALATGLATVLPLLLAGGCAVAPTPYGPEVVGPEVVVPAGVAYVGPTYPMPAPGYSWQFNVNYGWGWYHPRYGWHRGWR